MIVSEIDSSMLALNCSIIQSKKKILSKSDEFLDVLRNLRNAVWIFSVIIVASYILISL